MGIKDKTSKAVNSFLSILKVFKNSAILLKVKNLKTASKDCFILGNGPSMNDDIKRGLSNLTDKEIFVANSFCLSDHYKTLKPKYYVLADPIYWNNELCSERDRVIDGIVNSTGWDVNLFVPVFAKKSRFFDHLPSRNKHLKLYYFNTTNIMGGFRYLDFVLYRKHMGMPVIQNVLVGCVFLALNIGFKKIYLLGADHSWHEHIVVDDNNVLCIQDSYNSLATDTKLSPMLHPDGKSFKIDELFLALSRMFQAHIILEEYSKTLGSKIYNASSKSYIDAYERIKII